MSNTRRGSFSIARWTAAFAVALCLCTCDDGQVFECKKPAECVGRPGADTCMVIGGKGRCVVGCASVNGMDNCPPAYRCAGTADDGGTYCVR